MTTDMAGRTALARPLPFALAVLAGMALDQIIKQIVERTLALHVPVDVMPFLSLYRTYNEGISFSFLEGQSAWLLSAIAVVVIAFVLSLWRRTDASRWLAHAGFAMIIAGAVGNLIDRVIYGHVIDYILFHTQTWSFAVFNLADAFISVGAALIILDELLSLRHKDG